MSNESMASGLNMLRAVMAAIILANLVSIYGQVQWFAHDQHLPLIGAVGAAVSLESIALALSAMAHHAMVAGDSSWSLAGGSRGMSIVAGIINLSHYSPHGITHPSTLGIVFGLLSSSSGFMWGAYARRIARDKFIEQGVIEKRTVKVGMPLWVLHTGVAFDRLRTGVYYGENRLPEVRRLVETKRIEKQIEAEAKEAANRSEQEAEQERMNTEMTLENASTKADAIRIALAYLGDAATSAEVVSYLANAQPRAWAVSDDRVRQVKRRQPKMIAAPPASNVRAIRAHRESGPR